jgi:hypothetical protein
MGDRGRAVTGTNGCHASRCVAAPAGCSGNVTAAHCVTAACAGFSACRHEGEEPCSRQHFRRWARAMPAVVRTVQEILSAPLDAQRPAQAWCMVCMQQIRCLHLDGWFKGLLLSCRERRVHSRCGRSCSFPGACHIRPARRTACCRRSCCGRSSPGCPPPRRRHALPPVLQLADACIGVRQSATPHVHDTL